MIIFNGKLLIHLQKTEWTSTEKSSPSTGNVASNTLPTTITNERKSSIASNTLPTTITNERKSSTTSSESVATSHHENVS